MNKKVLIISGSPRKGGNSIISSPVLIGIRKLISQHIRYERNPQNRKKAIKLQGHVCRICGFDYDKAYGTELADDYIEVHHIRQLSEGQQSVDPSKDLITVCANCHRMRQRRWPGWRRWSRLGESRRSFPEEEKVKRSSVKRCSE